MSQVVLSDAQMGLFQTLRPMPNFERIYQGQPGVTPIAFPGVLDPDAGKDGFDSNLLAGFPVPLRAWILMLLPIAIDQYTPVLNYAYQVIFRIRNQDAAREAILSDRPAAGYHLASIEQGRKEILATQKSLVFIPGISDVELFPQTEPGGTAPAIVDARPVRYLPQISPSWVRPLTPSGGNAVWQQGVYQFTSNVECAGPTFAPFMIRSQGDEMSVLVYKTAAESVNPWDFAGADKGFSNTYGTNDGGLPLNPNIGILISTGVQGS